MISSLLGMRLFASHVLIKRESSSGSQHRACHKPRSGGACCLWHRLAHSASNRIGASCEAIGAQGEAPPVRMEPPTMDTANYLVFGYAVLGIAIVMGLGYNLVDDCDDRKTKAPENESPGTSGRSGQSPSLAKFANCLNGAGTALLTHSPRQSGVSIRSLR
jgi:hypothetical protein